MKLSCTTCGKPLFKKDALRCHGCGAKLCPEHTYRYVDGNNEAITRNSPDLCRRCYQVRYIQVSDQLPPGTAMLTDGTKENTIVVKNIGEAR